MQNPKPVKLTCAMPMIQQPSRLPLALLISVLVNGVLLMGLSLLLDPLKVRQQPLSQRLSLNTVLVPIDTPQPNQPETADALSQETPATSPQPEPLKPDPLQSPAPETNTAPPESPVATTTNEADNAISNDTEVDREIEPTDAPVAIESPSNEVASERETDSKTEHLTPGATTNSASNTRLSESDESEPPAEQETILQSDNRDVLINQEPAQLPPEDMNPGAPPNAENLPLAQIDHQSELEYPAMAKRRRQQGQVVLRAWINEQGGLEQLSILTSSGHPLLDESALEQIKTWTFQSGADSRSHRWVQIPIEFRLR